MNDPTLSPSGWANALGIQLGIVVAGFAGGVVSTLFATNLTRTQAIGSIIASLLTAAYFTPAAVIYFNVQQPPYQYCTAFLIGLCTMSLIPAVKAIANRYISSKLQGLPPTGNPPGGEKP